MGELWLVDPETGRLMRVNTRSRRLRERFASAAAEERRRARARARLARRAPPRPHDLGRLAALARRLPQAGHAVSFERPLALIALVVIPVVIGLYYARERRRTQFASRWGSPALLPNVIDRSPGKLRYLPLAILLVALAAMVVGVARPHAVVSVKREEATVVLAIDVSRSMKADDVEPTRLDAAREAAKVFVDEVPKKFRVGVVSFASRANSALPPTEDRDAGRGRARLAEARRGHGDRRRDRALRPARHAISSPRTAPGRPRRCC